VRYPRPLLGFVTPRHVKGCFARSGVVFGLGGLGFPTFPPTTGSVGWVPPPPPPPRGEMGLAGGEGPSPRGRFFFLGPRRVVLGFWVGWFHPTGESGPPPVFPAREWGGFFSTIFCLGGCFPPLPPLHYPQFCFFFFGGQAPFRLGV